VKLDQLDPAQLAMGTGQEISETEPIADFPRLLEALADDSGQAQWTAVFKQTGQDPTRPVQMRLTGRAQCNVPCVRCLDGLPVELAIDRNFELVTDEQTAAALDAQNGDRDVLAAPAPWNLAELVEDEFLLALPLMPRHEKCEIPAYDDASESVTDSLATERRFPFADLEDLLTQTLNHLTEPVTWLSSKINDHPRSETCAALTITLLPLR